MKTKTEFITIKPKSEEAKEYFNLYLRQLHSCKVIKRTDHKVLVNSIAGNYTFWVNVKGDTNWEILK